MASEDRVCSQCGATFTVQYRCSTKTFCSRSCAVTSHAHRLGSTNSNWRGGKTKHPLYEVYIAMVGRCHNANAKRYASYGGRGIYVCDRWREDFWNFVNDMGERPLVAPGSKRPHASLDRIDNDGPYSPDNCRWATYKQQSENSRRRPPQERDTTSGRFVSI